MPDNILYQEILEEDLVEYLSKDHLNKIAGGYKLRFCVFIENMNTYLFSWIIPDKQ